MPNDKDKRYGASGSWDDAPPSPEDSRVASLLHPSAYGVDAQGPKASLSDVLSALAPYLVPEGSQVEGAIGSAVKGIKNLPYGRLASETEGSLNLAPTIANRVKGMPSILGAGAKTAGKMISSAIPEIAEGEEKVDPVMKQAMTTRAVLASEKAAQESAFGRIPSAVKPEPLPVNPTAAPKISGWNKFGMGMGGIGAGLYAADKLGFGGAIQEGAALGVAGGQKMYHTIFDKAQNTPAAASAQSAPAAQGIDWSQVDWDRTTGKK